MVETVSARDRLTALRMELVELRRACNHLHKLYWDDHEISWVNYQRQCHENEAHLVRMLGRIRALETEVASEAPATPAGTAHPRPGDGEHLDPLA